MERKVLQHKSPCYIEKTEKNVVDLKTSHYHSSIKEGRQQYDKVWAVPVQERTRKSLAREDYAECIKYSYASINIGKELNYPEVRMHEQYTAAAISFYNLGHIFDCLLIMKKALALRQDKELNSLYIKTASIFAKKEFALGFENIKNDKIRDAIKHFKRSCMFQRKRIGCHLRLSSCYSQLGNKKIARKYLKMVTTKII
uniref:TPR_REGION domain-containing protein n=1 Tax=Rhabditophanes sp. KR3021 TaxID=114890 RepID=A0AC35UDG1_9BILA